MTNDFAANKAARSPAAASARAAVILAVVLVGAASTLVQMPSVGADEPESPAPTQQVPSADPGGVPTRPSGPPAEAINCVQPSADNPRPELDASGLLAITLDDASRKVTLTISAVPGGATCYSVFRDPADINPVLFAYSPDQLQNPGEKEDPFGIPSAGRYCYSLIFGSRDGSSKPFKTCIDIPESFAPKPTPTPVFTPPRQPVDPPNTGTSPSPSSAPALPQLLLFAIGSAALVAGGYGAVRRRCSGR